MPRSYGAAKVLGEKSGHATINHSINRKIPPSARWPFIFWSSPDNKPIDAWSKNHGTILQCQGVMELRIFGVKKSGHATINHSTNRKIPPSARWPFIFWSSPDNKPIDAWSKSEELWSCKYFGEKSGHATNKPSNHPIITYSNIK